MMNEIYSRKLHAARMVLFRVQGIFTEPEKKHLYDGVDSSYRLRVSEKMTLLFRSVGKIFDVIKNTEMHGILPENTSIEDMFVGVQTDLNDLYNIVLEIESQMAKENKDEVILAKWNTFRDTLQTLVELLNAERHDIHSIEEMLTELLLIKKRKIS